MADSIDPRVVIGHVHLKVADLDRAVTFYSGVLGFEVTTRSGDAAAFLSAGGYHHHIGLNTWESRGAAPPPAGIAALRQATLVLPGAAERDAVLERLERHGHTAQESGEGPVVRDPAGNALVLAVA